MKSVQIRKDTWHYWVATTVCSWEPYKEKGKWATDSTGKFLRDANGNLYCVGAVENDFCSYVRGVIFGSILVLAIASLILAALGFELTGAYWLVRGLLGHHLSKDQVQIVTVFVTTLIAGVLIGFCFATKYFLARRRKLHELYPERYLAKKAPKPPKPDGFIKLAYTSFKDKICFRVTVIGDSDGP